VGLSRATLAEIDRLVVGCGGMARELLAFSGSATEEKSTPGQRVSAADTLIDSILRERLPGIVPGSAGYSEEGGRFGARLGARVRWQVDPLDGTRPASLGGAFAVSVGALVWENNAPVAAVGWIYIPTNSALYRGIWTPDFSECLRNAMPAEAASFPNPDEWEGRYVAVDSRFRREWLGPATPKITAPGATAVNVAHLAHPPSDVGAVILSSYRPYDAFAGLPLAAAAGCAIYAWNEDDGGWDRASLPLLELLAALDEEPEQRGPLLLVAHPANAVFFPRAAAR
jgi:fructose-1,6-bisphosphatase/inositol monophosphatase family enzyme